VKQYRVLASAGHRIDEIFRHTRDRWGEPQAERYVRGLFACFDAIADRRVIWRPIPAEFGVDGYFCRYEQHFVYWRQLRGDVIGIVTVLHARMHQIERFRDDFGA
jgi:toxin ParE1/3/4